VIACVLVVVAIVFIFTKLPEVKAEDSGGHGTEFSFKVFRIPRVRWAVIAEFFYVGAQVGVTSFFVRFSRYTANIPEKDAGAMLGGAMVGFMAGRFLGTFLMKYIKPARLLSIYAVANIVLLCIAVSAHGDLAVYAMMAIPFFLSIMFPTIFALGIFGLGAQAKKASAFIVMAIMGGAVMPKLMGAIADRFDMSRGFIVPAFCFAFVAFYGFTWSRFSQAESLHPVKIGH
jgi:FHS family L-fucose permease-like MFS transporter